MKRYGIAAALSACLLAAWNCGASEPSQPSAQSCPPTARGAVSGTLASSAVVAATTPASETVPFNPTLSPYQDCAVCRELYSTSAATHTFENLSPPSENNGIPVDRSALVGIGVPINLSKNCTLRPWISYGMPGGSENGDTAKPLGKAVFGMSLSYSF